MPDETPKPAPIRPVREHPASEPQPTLPEPARPTPVRAAMRPEDESSSTDSGTPTATVEVDGVVWTVTVLGRARGGPSATPTPLLLLGFSRSDDEGVCLETLIAADRLDGLSELDLLDALAGATPPPDPDRQRAPFFPGATERRNRGG